MRFRHIGPMAFVLLGTATYALANAQSKENRLHAELSGSSEVPAVSSTGHGKFVAQVAPGDDYFTYELSYDGLEGSVLQAHIHLGQKSVNGGIMIWLCSTASNSGTSRHAQLSKPGWHGERHGEC